MLPRYPATLPGRRAVWPYQSALASVSVCLSICLSVCLFLFFLSFSFHPFSLLPSPFTLPVTLPSCRPAGQPASFSPRPSSSFPALPLPSPSSSPSSSSSFLLPPSSFLLPPLPLPSSCRSFCQSRCWWIFLLCSSHFEMFIFVERKFVCNSLLMSISRGICCNISSPWLSVCFLLPCLASLSFCVSSCSSKHLERNGQHRTFYFQIQSTSTPQPISSPFHVTLLTASASRVLFTPLSCPSLSFSLQQDHPNTITCSIHTRLFVNLSCVCARAPSTRLSQLMSLAFPPAQYSAFASAQASVLHHPHAHRPHKPVQAAWDPTRPIGLQEPQPGGILSHVA